ncbi:MAG: hypothetical protein ABH877_02725 [bacterium]
MAGQGAFLVAQVLVAVETLEELMGNMYDNTKTWSPFVGCRFACTYCVPSFQRQAKRQRGNCEDCYAFGPHEHPERLPRIPSAEIVFCCASGDISFATTRYRIQIAKAIHGHAARRRKRMEPPRTYYLQSKRPSALEDMLPYLPPEAVLVTTLESNRGEGYPLISCAPALWERFCTFSELKWPRKVVTVEPVLDFDVEVFPDRLINIKPEYIWLGFNSHPKQVALPEPSEEKIGLLVGRLRSAGIPVRGKDLRGLVLP